MYFPREILEIIFKDSSLTNVNNYRLVCRNWSFFLDKNYCTKFLKIKNKRTFNKQELNQLTYAQLITWFELYGGNVLCSSNLELYSPYIKTDKNKHYNIYNIYNIKNLVGILNLQIDEDMLFHLFNHDLVKKSLKYTKKLMKKSLKYTPYKSIHKITEYKDNKNIIKHAIRAVKKDPLLIINLNKRPDVPVEIYWTALKENYMMRHHIPTSAKQKIYSNIKNTEINPDIEFALTTENFYSNMTWLFCIGVILLIILLTQKTKKPTDTIIFFTFGLIVSFFMLCIFLSLMTTWVAPFVLLAGREYAGETINAAIVSSETN